MVINKIKNSVLVILALAFMISAYLLYQSSEENKRLGDNQTTLLGKVKYYKTSDSLNAAGVDRLLLTNGEFKKHNSDLLQTIERLELRIKRLQSISLTGIATKSNIKTPVKDSLIYLPGKTDTIRCINYTDGWMKVVGCFENKQFIGTIESKDTILQAVHRVPRKFLFFKYGTKAIRQEVVSKNPNSTISYTKYIEFKR